MSTQNRSVIETFTGGFFDFANPRAEDIHINDIAAALANTCRFGGHVSQFYSVAEHAVLVYDLVRHRVGQIDEHAVLLCLAALHHDSHEAYVGDVPTPLKRMLGETFADLTWSIDWEIALALGIPNALFHDDVVLQADELALAQEAAVLKVSGGTGPNWGGRTMPFPTPLERVRCWSPVEAERRFLAAHREAMEAL